MNTRIFLDDGSRDAWDCDNNYLYFNSDDKEAETIIIKVMQENDLSDSDVRNELRRLCIESFQKNNIRESKNKLSFLYKYFKYST